MSWKQARTWACTVASSNSCKAWEDNFRLLNEALVSLLAGSRGGGRVNISSSSSSRVAGGGIC